MWRLHGRSGSQPFEVRFETPSGYPAQVDFARFVITEEPGIVRIVRLFSLMLGHSRHIFARFVMHLLCCHTLSFSAIDRVPIEILYDRVKMAVTGEDAYGHIIYNVR